MANKKIDETKRKRILVTREYVNTSYIFYNKSFEEAAAALEELRMKYIEYIVLYNYEVQFDNRGYIEVTRDENDNEYNKRIEKLMKSREYAAKRRDKIKAEAEAKVEAKRKIEEKRERELLKQLKAKYEGA